ncbi:hypothetical protein AAC387_Pa12g1878 [Persea americana]
MAAEVVLSSILHDLLRNLSLPVQDKLERRQEDKMAVRDWLRKLKDAAYDAENLVDEFRIEALRRKVENQDGMLKKVGNLFHPLVFRFKMANKVQELRERFNDIAKERNDFHFREGVIEIPPPISTTRETCSYVIESEVYGRDRERRVNRFINQLRK